MAMVSSSSALESFLGVAPLNETLSGVFGSISMTAWICLLLPQLWQNYKARSAEGLSMAFLFVWLLGDVANFSGALFTSLAPTAIALAVYFCATDFVLIAQCVYYNAINGRKRTVPPHTITRIDEESPLLDPSTETSSDESPAPIHKPIAHTQNGNASSESMFNNILFIIAVYVIGTVGWFASHQIEHSASPPETPKIPESSAYECLGLVLGYGSAVLYLCARVPQIVKNYNEKSCEGLSLLFFLLSMTGNITYGLSLIAYSQEKRYLLTALPWLIGSLGTIVEDIVIFVQFRIYAGSHRAPVATA